MTNAASLHTFGECLEAVLAWREKRKEDFDKHAKTVMAPIAGLEPQFWPDRMTELADAYGWAMMYEPEIRELEQQALAILTGEDDIDTGKRNTMARSEVLCASIHSLDKALKALATTADRKLSTLQSLNRQR
jgi:hypothetical protein